MTIRIYLFFNGDCEAAFRTYEKHLGGRDVMLMRYGGSPGEAAVPADWKDKVMHGSMRLGDVMLLASDAPPGRYDRPQGFRVNLAAETPEQARRMFDALADGGTVEMALEKTFFAPAFGQLRDRFGIPWQVMVDQPG